MTENEGQRRRSTNRSVGRRTVLKSAFGVAALGCFSSVGATSSSNQPGTASVIVEDQTTDGDSIVVKEISTHVDARFSVFTSSGERLAGGTLESGERLQDYRITVNSFLRDESSIQVSVYDESGTGIARDEATVTLSSDVTLVEGMDVTFVEANSDAGFNYPYYLYAPSVPESEAGGPILVQPNNSGEATDNFEVHRESAKRLATGTQTGGRLISDRLGVPFVVPAFPRPRSTPVHYHTYVHALDRDTVQVTSGKLERVDRQLLSMVEDARRRLDEQSYPVEDGIMLNGFSASGNFVNRFAALHPEEVVSVTAGGINGTPILPIREAKGHTLNYHIGVADIEELTGKPFDLEAFQNVNQFLYIGELDFNDTIGYRGPWQRDQEEIALDVYGSNIQRERMPYSKSVYEEQDVSAAFKIYEGAGHTPSPAMDDLVAFHRASIEGADISDFGGNVPTGDGGEGAPPEIELDISPEKPAAGETVEFDASASTVPTGEILSYTWRFDDGESAAGPMPTHSFADSGIYEVALTVVDDRGLESHALKEVVVSEGENAATTSSSGNSTDASSGGSSSASAPGLGVAGALASLGGASYLFNRRQEEE